MTPVEEIEIDVLKHVVDGLELYGFDSIEEATVVSAIIKSGPLDALFSWAKIE